MRTRRVLACLLAAGTTVCGVVGGSLSSSYAGTSSHRPGIMRHGGTLAVEVYDSEADDDQVWLVNGDGTDLRPLTGLGYQQAHWSPDGSMLVAALSDLDARFESALIDPRSGATRLLPMPDPDLVSRCFVWSPRGDRLGCEAWDPTTSDPVVGGQYTVRASDGSDLTPIFVIPSLDGDFGGFSPDARSMVFDQQNTDTDRGLYVARVNGSLLRRVTHRAMFVQSGGDFSPSGRWIAFSARASDDVRQSLWLVHPNGRRVHGIHLRGPDAGCGGSFSDPDSFGCSDPVWSPDGRYLVYRRNSGDGSELHVARVDGTHVRVVTTSSDHSFDVEGADWGPYLTR